MSVRVGINGFGRIGRQVLKAGLERKNLEFVALNDIADISTLAYLFKYDSIFGKFNGRVETDGAHLIINGTRVKVFNEKDPSQIPWADLGVDVVIEASGIFRSRDKAGLHLRGTVKKVIITAPSKGEPADATFVMGVNHESYDPQNHHIVSNASCTTNAFAPLVKVLHENFRILQGVMTTVHSYTNDQRLLDAPHRDYRRARAAALSTIPTSTGAAKAISLIFPDLKGKLSAIALRVPTPDASLVDFAALVEKEVNAESVNEAFKRAAENELKGFMEYSTEPIVSVDIIGNEHSVVFDSTLTQVAGGNLVKVFGWYDNEWAYSVRVVDLLEYMISKGL